ncbi:MAG: hypothetical protein AB1489_12585 [Acidobacteriota bacterium]
MLRSVFTFLLMLCFSLSAAGWQGSDQQPGSPYFPQSIGDEHVYRKTGRLAGEGAGWTDRVTRQEGRFFQHSNYWGDDVARWVAVNKKGTVVERGTQTGRPFIWYKFGNITKNEWTLQLAVEGPPCVSGARVKIVSRTETVEVPAGTFTTCLKLEFSTNCADAGIVEQWFALNVGLVKQTETTIGGPLISELVSAKVGGVSYPK